MRILSVTQTYAPFAEFGGPPAKVLAIAEHLATRGHEVTVLTADWGVRKHSRSTPVEASPYGPRAVNGGVETFYFSTKLRYRTATWNPSARRFCRDQLRRYDVAHIYGLYDLLGPAVTSACRRARLPYVVEPIGMYVPIVRRLWVKRLYHALLGSRMIAGAQAVIATSKQEARELAGAGVAAGRIVQRRNGIEAPATFPPRGTFRSKLNLPCDAKVVLFLGRIAEKKSPGLLLDAFAHLKEGEQDKQTHLVFAGPDDGGLGRGLRQRARLLGLSERVHIVGPLYDADKWGAFRDAEVFVLPSQNENFGNAAAEAVAAGTPAIITENCGIAEILDKGAALIVPHSRTALTDALRRVLHDEGLRAGMKAAQEEAARRLGWDAPVIEMERLYETFLRQA